MNYFADRLDDVSGHNKKNEHEQSKVVAEVKFPNQLFGVFDLHYSPKGDFIVLCFGQGAIQVRFATNGELRRTIRSGGTHSYPVNFTIFHPQNTDLFYVGSSDGHIFKCDSIKGDYEKSMTEERNEIYCMDIGYDGENLVSGGKDAKLRVYDLHTNKMIQIYQRSLYTMNSAKELNFHRMRIYCVKFHPRMNNVFISGGWDDYLRVWDLREPNGCVRKVQGPHICGRAIDIKDKNILTGSWVVMDGLQLWDFDSMKLVSTITPKNRPTTINGEFLYAAQYFDCDNTEDLVVVGGSGIGNVEIISLSKKEVISKFRIFKPCQTLDTHDNRIVFGGMENCFRIADFDYTSYLTFDDTTTL